MVSREEALMQMINNEDYEAVCVLLKNKVNINYQNNVGVTPLLCATEKGNYRITKLLLDHGADCNGRGRLTEFHYSMGIPRHERVLEWTPLINAALYGHPDIVKLLIENGADINFRDINGRSALNTALQQSMQKCAEILIRNGAEVTPLEIATAKFTCPHLDIRKLLVERERVKKSETKNRNLSLHPAARCGNREELRELIKKGADINRQDKEGNSALHVALENGKLDCAEFLIKKGADVNIKGKNKSTPLHVAAFLGLTKIIPCLVEQGAIIDAKGDDDITPLHFAVFHSFPLCVKQLLDYGASVNAMFAGGKTALHVAVSKSSDCIELLLKENADIFAKDDLGVCPLELSIELGYDAFRKLIPGNYKILSEDGTTPFHIAAHCCRIDCLQKMIEDGCDVNIKTNCGDTPLHFACKGGVALSAVFHELPEEDSQNVEMLVQAGADIHTQNVLGMSPIHVCAKNGLVAPMRALLKAGAEINSQGGDKKQTPLHYAAESGSLTCIKYLVEKGADKLAVNSDSFTALMLAARNNHFSCVKFLLQIDVPLWIP
ncbi:hypothetical protein R5R35_007495 [Gryllus longicercus]|uniref:Ankyrin repeat protein n=1 Tax=Gryllus longicercus TaxID=2509291 RepID=A0AAN9W174_9ORTH